MLISLEWLKEYVDIDENKSIEELENALTMIGQEVEAIEEMGKDLNKVKVGQVVEYGKHPDSDHLSLCKINIGAEENLQIICGAPNHKEGDKVAVATIGAVLPGGFKIKKAKVRGVESQGMLCSEKELAIGEDHEGIMILPQDAPVGEDLKTYLDIKDTVFELEITPNRPDCLSHIGIAREVAAYYNKKVKYPANDITEISEKTSDLISINIEDTERCKRYATRIIKGVEIKESPKWLKKKLSAIGLRSINNVVDITNYVLMEYNHPMHAFDYSKIEGQEIIVRTAREGEKIVTLDGEERELNGELLIADKNRAIAIAGVMGGANSEVSEETKDILLEVAYFTPENIRKTSKKLTLSSDASYRFERGIDIEGTLTVIDRASKLIQEVAGGEILNGIVDEYVEVPEKREIEISVSRLNRFIGKELLAEEMLKILENLELGVKLEGDIITVIPTSFRNDLERPADIYEEVIRMYGFENIEAKMPEENISSGVLSQETKRVDYVKNSLKELGLQEVINYSFIPREALKKIKFTGETLEIMNPINEDMIVMRPSLVYSLLTNVKDNFNRNIFDLNIFEVSRVFNKTEGDLADEPVKFAIAIAGRRNKSVWEAKPEAYDFYDLKAYVEGIFDSIGFKRYNLERSTNEAYHPGRSADIFVGKDLIGTIGEIHPNVLEATDINKERVYIAEIDMKKVFKYAKNKITYKKVVKYPAVERDLAIVLDEDSLVGKMIDSIKKSSPLIEKVDLFDVYRGKGVEEGKKSVAINIVLRSEKGTLEEAEVNKTMEKILGIISKKFKGELRK